MKKLLLLALLVAGGVSTVSATTRIYIKANDWATASATFKINLFKNGVYQADIRMTNLRNDVYYADVNEVSCDKFQILRMNPECNVQWNYTGSNNSIDGTKLFLFPSTGGNPADNPTLVQSEYLPTEYYFVSDKNGSWASVAKMTESAGTYSYAISASDYSGKYFAWCTGEALSSAGAIVDWKGVFASAGAGGSAQDMGFLSITYPSMYPDQNGQRWRVLSDLVSAGATIDISYTPSTNSAVVSAYRTLTIGDAGYATWSNGEKYVIDGTNVDDVYVVSADNTSTVTLTSVKGYTFPAGEGVIIKGSGTVTINAVASDATPATITTNYLVGSGNSSTTPATGDNYYVFSWDGEHASSVGFYKASGGTLAAHKAYLNLGAGSARGFLGFDFDETTGISNLTPAFNEDAVYDMQGRKVAQPTKGLYIINGKKVVIK